MYIGAYICMHVLMYTCIHLHTRSSNLANDLCLTSTLYSRMISQQTHTCILLQDLNQTGELHIITTGTISYPSMSQKLGQM